jgi:16S rRNA (guanine966-N2)-methyltransferase
LRIISGTYRGRNIPVPSGFRARPTTDFAREGLFNILRHQLDFEGMRVADLFGGTGSISLEFVSLGAGQIDFVERDQNACNFLRKTMASLKIDNIRIHRSDVFRFLEYTSLACDLVFADPPYQLESIPAIPGLVLESKILTDGGLFILEHGKTHSFDTHPGFREMRKYGSVHFSFFDKS